MKLIDKIKKLFLRKTADHQLTFTEADLGAIGEKCKGSELFAGDFVCPNPATRVIESALPPEVVEITGFNVYRMSLCDKCVDYLFLEKPSFSIGYSIDFEEIEPAAKKSFTESANRAMFDKTSSRGRFQK